jgi:hypothetical protein
MNYQQMLLSKNGFATMKLAKEFLRHSIGSNIPTITDLCEEMDIARGTVQNSLKFLQTNKAIELESRGHLGTFLIQKNTRILLEFSGIKSIVGVMPLPYSKKYEGFASGLIVAMENQYNVPAYMAYMRGAVNRIGMLLSDRYDYAVVSKYAANEFLKKSDTIMIVKAFGVHSYLSEHIVIFHNKKISKIMPGMKIGIDADSIDQKDLTEKVCKGIDVTFVQTEYSQILDKVISGDIDAAVWNKDEITDKLVEINYINVAQDNEEDTEAVIVVSKDKSELAILLNEIIDADVVVNIQKLVLDGKITPSY